MTSKFVKFSVALADPVCMVDTVNINQAMNPLTKVNSVLGWRNRCDHVMCNGHGVNEIRRLHEVPHIHLDSPADVCQSNVCQTVTIGEYEMSSLAMDEAQTSATEPSSRLSLRLSPQAVDAINRIISLSGGGITASEAVRRAIGTELSRLERQMNGEKLLVEKPNGEIRELVFVR